MTAARFTVGLAVVLSAVSCSEAPSRPQDPSVPITPLELPATELEAADGAVSLGGFRGPTVLHFWATWCASCTEELPPLMRLADGLDGARVLAVTDESWSTVRAHFAPAEVPRWVVRDSQASLARELGVTSLPDTYVVDRGRVARRRIAGSRDWGSPTLISWARSLPRNE